MSPVSRLFRGRARAPVEVDRAELRLLLECFPALQQESVDALARRVGEVLAHKTFLGAGGFEPDERDCLVVALLAAQPVLELGIDWYRDFHTFILYPGAFRAELEEVDEFGLVHQGEEIRAGEAWANGPVVLAMDEVRASAQGQAYNVVAHELAHQIDQLNGEMDGFPPLHPSMSRIQWSETFGQAWQRLQHSLEQGLEPELDPYAAESPAEFFAVTSELFFDVPNWFADTQPALFRQLEAFYRPGRCRAS